MGRIIAIDYGTKRVGIASTDPLKIIANPLTTVSEKESIKYISDYSHREDVEKIVVGMPLKLSGEPTDSTPHVIAFVKRLRNKLTEIPIVTEDETFSTKNAVKIMVAGGMKKKARRNKSNIDKISASLILQSYLDSGM